MVQKAELNTHHNHGERQKSKLRKSVVVFLINSNLAVRSDVIRKASNDGAGYSDRGSGWATDVEF